MEKVICLNCGADNTPKSKYCSSCGFELPKIKMDSSIENDPRPVAKSNDSKKKILGAIIGVIAFFVAYYGVQHIFFNSRIDKEMMNVASELNKSCPIMVDSETRLDKTVALPDKIFQYNYTLVNVDKSSADTISMKNYLEPNILNHVKSSPQMQNQRDYKWTLNYCYKDKNGLHLLMVVVTPDKYK